MTRIVGGRLSGRRLVTPGGTDTRPTAEKVRAGIANALAAAGAIEGAAVLDLYAGSGALGLELASRGAARVVLVDSSRAAHAAIRANIAALDVPGVTLFAGDAAAFAGVAGQEFDIVLADPPYDVTNDAVAAVLGALVAGGRLRPHADLVVERPARSGAIVWPAPLVAVKTRRYGDTLVCYGRAP